MRQTLLKTFSVLVLAGGLHATSFAQDRNQDQSDRKGRENDEIVIRKKGDKDTKVTVEITGDEVKVNGKPMSEFKDDNISIQRRRSSPNTQGYTFGRTSPFRGGVWNYNDNDDLAKSLGGNANRAYLGVSYTKDEKGAKVNTVMKETAAEKAGLKSGDIITKVNDKKIVTPEDLTQAIGEHKPEDKVSLTYLRDNKEMKADIVLTRRTGPYFPENFDLRKNFNFDFQGPDGPNMLFRSGGPRLGIKAQDTEEGKGVKVLGVDQESNAEKAGIKEGDLITDFDGKAVNSATELADAAREAKDKSSIKLKVNRDGKNRDVEIKVPKKLKTATL